MVLESGTRVTLRYARERTRGQTPRAIGTAVTNIAMGTGGTGEAHVFLTGTTCLAEGICPKQYIKLAGFAAAANNKTWQIKRLDSETDIVVYDPLDSAVIESAATVQTLKIVMNELRATGRNINLEKNILESAEVRPSRQISDYRHGFNRVVGSPGFELSRAAYDDIMELGLGGAWTTPTAVTNVSANSLTPTGQTANFIRTTGSFITDGYRPGDIIAVTGFGAAANNAQWRVKAVTALNLTVFDHLDVIVTETASSTQTVTYVGKRCDIGTNLNTIVVERVFAATGKYQVFNGVAVNTFTPNITPEEMVGGTLDLLGMSAATMASSPLSSEALNVLGAFAPYAAFEGSLYEGGAPLGVVTSVEWAVNNNRSLNPVIGSRFSPDVFEGRARLNGTATCYFQDETLFNKFVNETESSYFIRLTDPIDPLHFVNMVAPRVKYTGAPMDPPQEGPVPLEMPFAALEHATYATSLWIQTSNGYPEPV